MKRFLVELYAIMLKLYPSGFYDEFANEMRAVFEKAVDERPLMAALREFRDFPFSVLREYRRKEMRLMSFYQFSSLAVLMMIGIYIIMGILPYIGYTVFDIAPFKSEYGIDPKCIYGFHLYIAAVLVTMVTPFWMIGWGISLSTSVVRNWQLLTYSQRSGSMMVLALLIGFMLFFLSPIGMEIFGWILD